PAEGRAHALIGPLAEPLALENVVPRDAAVASRRFPRGALRRGRVAIKAARTMLRSAAGASRLARSVLSTGAIETKQALAAVVGGARLPFFGKRHAAVNEARRDGAPRRVLADERAEEAGLASRMVARRDRLRADARLIRRRGLRTEAEPSGCQDTRTQKA